jgi:hypothetical protein
MSTVPALTASGPRELKRARPIPAKVRTAVDIMVFGKPDDENCAPIGFVEAASIAGIAADQMRRYLDRADVRKLILDRRKTFREALCSGNELALKRQRDLSKNGMVVVAAVRQLEEMGGPDNVRNGNQATAGISIRILNVAPQPQQLVTAPAIEHEPAAPIEDSRDPIFRDPNRAFRD